MFGTMPVVSSKNIRCRRSPDTHLSFPIMSKKTSTPSKQGFMHELKFDSVNAHTRSSIEINEQKNKIPRL